MILEWKAIWKNSIRTFHILLNLLEKCTNAFFSFQCELFSWFIWFKKLKTSYNSKNILYWFWKICRWYNWMFQDWRYCIIYNLIQMIRITAKPSVKFHFSYLIKCPNATLSLWWMFTYCIAVIIFPVYLNAFKYKTNIDFKIVYASIKV